MEDLEKTVRHWERVRCKKGKNQTKCELLVIKGALVLKHFYVMRATALTFRKTSTTIDYAKPAVFESGVYLCWQSGECFSYFQTEAYFWNHSEMDCSAFVQLLNSQFYDSKGRTVAYYLGYSLCNIKQAVFKSDTHFGVYIERWHTGKLLQLTLFCQIER